MSDEATGTATAAPAEGGGTHFTEQAEASEPASPDPAPSSNGFEPSDTPDLSEQERTLVAKLAGPLGEAVAERLGQQNGDTAEADAPTPDEIAAKLLGYEPASDLQQAADTDDDVVYETPDGRFVDAQGREVPPEMVITYDDEGREVPAAQQTPPLDPRVDQIIEYIQREQQEKQEQEIRKIAEENPDLRQPEMLQAVERHAERLAREAGDPSLATNPLYVKAALAVARSERAAPPPSPDEARNQGATLPTDASASVSGSRSAKDQFWEEIKQAGSVSF